MAIALVLVVGPGPVHARQAALMSSGPEPAARAIEPAMPTSVPILAPEAPPTPGYAAPDSQKARYRESLRRQREARLRPPPPPSPSPPSPPSMPPRGVGMMITGGVFAVPATGLAVLLGLAVRASPALAILAFLDGKVPARMPSPGGLVPLGLAAVSSAAEEPVTAFGEFKGPSGAVMFTFAGLFFATGVTLLTLGGLRHKRWRKWKDNQTSAGTWTPGLVLRF